MCGNLPVFRSTIFMSFRYSLCIDQYAGTWRFEDRSGEGDKIKIYCKIQGDADKDWKIADGQRVSEGLL